MFKRANGRDDIGHHRLFLAAMAKIFGHGVSKGMALFNHHRDGAVQAIFARSRGYRQFCGETLALVSQNLIHSCDYRHDGISSLCCMSCGHCAAGSAKAQVRQCGSDRPDWKCSQRQQRAKGQGDITSNALAAQIADEDRD